MKIFYSWQSDTPDAIGKSLVRRALDQAVSTLTEALELSEADRPTVDQDTQGVLGSPAIAETIFEKIRGAEIVMLDVTLTGATPEGKRLINSNVAYELGFAHGHHGDRVLLKVMNAHYGGPEHLPFDLRHRRWPVRFSLSPDAQKAERKSARDDLAREIAHILREYARNAPAPTPYQPVPATAHPACYWNESEPLVRLLSNRGEDPVERCFGYANAQPLTYLRIWPDEALPAFSRSELNDPDLAAVEPLLGRAGGHSWSSNRHGTIAYSGRSAGYLIATTQVFKNREIWGVESFILRRQEGEDLAFNYVPTQAFEEGIRRSLGRYLRAAGRFGYGNRVHVEAGMVHVDNFRLAMPTSCWEKFWGPLYEDVVSVQTALDRTNEGSIQSALLKIFEAVFDAAGTARPENLYGLPKTG